jgi:hypothetical protein
MGPPVGKHSVIMILVLSTGLTEFRKRDSPVRQLGAVSSVTFAVIDDTSIGWFHTFHNV